MTVPIAEATSSCPAAQSHVVAYNRVEILNDKHVAAGYKLVNKPFYVKAVHISEDKKETFIVGTGVTIYFCNNGICQGLNKQRLVSGSTDSKGEYKYVPTKLGKYLIDCAGKGVMIDIKMLYDDPSDFGAVCGNGVCEKDKLETLANCPADCTVCGDAVCEGNENKDNCPDDCIICGDDVCDPEEYTEEGCSCLEDCVKCGNGRCDSKYSETKDNCPQDCKAGGTASLKGATDFLSAYWWAIAAAAVVLVVLFLKREGLHVYLSRGKEKEEGRKARGKASKTAVSKGWVRESGTKGKAAEDDDVITIVEELMDAGVSDKSVIKKMEEFGLDEDEARAIIEKAKKRR
jgi:hypothetical protein